MKKWLCILMVFVLFCTSFVVPEADTTSPSVQIEDCEQLELYVGAINKTLLNYTLSPSGYQDEFKSWTSDNEDVVMIYNNAVIVPVGVGKATLTLETVNGLTDTIEIVVKEGSLISEGEIVESTNSSAIRPKVLNRFEPSVSGLYELSLLEYDETAKRWGIMVYEEGVYRQIKNLNTYISMQKSVQFELEAGKVYHLGTDLDASAGDINHSFTVTQVTPTPSPEPTPAPETITVGEKKEITVTESNQVQRYMFVPDETGIYKFSSSKYNDAFGEIYNSSEKLLDRGDNLYQYYGTYRYQGAFEIEYKFTAGEVYYLESSLPYSSSGTYSVSVEKLAVATEVSIASKDETELKYAMEQQLRLNFTPSDARDTVVSWVSDNPDVVTVSSGKIYGKSFGSANITVTTETGLTDTVKVTVIDHEEILEKETKGSWALGEPAYYKFIPETDGVYEAKTWQEFNGPTYPIRVVVYDEEFEEINSLLYSGNVELRADNIYYLCVNSLSDDIGDISNFMISKVGDLSEPLPTVEPTESPVPSIEPTELPDETETPEPTELPDETETPEPTETPDPQPSETPTICPTPEPTIVPTETIEPEILPGDTNGDENVNAEDALLVLKDAAKLIQLSASELEIGDVNEDEKVDAGDALEILKIAAGLIEK